MSDFATPSGAVCRNCLRPTRQKVKGIPYCSKSCIDERSDKWTRVAKQTTAYWKKRAEDSPQHEWCDSCEKSHWKHFDGCPYCGGQGKQVATDGGVDSPTDEVETYRVKSVNPGANAKSTTWVKAPSRRAAEQHVRETMNRHFIESCLPRTPGEDDEVVVL